MEDEAKIYDNVAFIDEYPELAKKVWLRRLARDRSLGRIASRESKPTEIFYLPTSDTPDDIA